ncbi:MAG TPA: putative quinol monooxygenase [Candidatus Deferrimicrobium sp.]|nr:putative quinol monooxygenase [Candidatus Deferrimicrobium sp.]
MITLIASFQIKEGKLDEAIAHLKEIVPKVRESEPGCLAYIPHTVKGAKNKNTIIFYEKYKDKEAFNLHSANLPKNFEKIFPLLEGAMDLKTCTEIM